MKIDKSTEITLDHFLKLPRVAQLLFFQEMEDNAIKPTENPYAYFYISGCFCVEGTESPIEKIFLFAFTRRTSERYGCDDTYYYLEPQYEIKIGDKRYRADFYVCFDNVDESMDAITDSVKLIIECDGHNFHEKTKAQVRRDNERDFDLKKAGYEVLHFSGSQIYNDPYKCADDVIDFINSRLVEAKKNYNNKL